MKPIAFVRSSNSAINNYFARSIENRKYKSKNRIGIRLRSCTNLSGRKQLAWQTDDSPHLKLLYGKAKPNLNSELELQTGKKLARLLQDLVSLTQVEIIRII